MEKKILIIEDEPVIAEMMSILLEEEGYKVISLSDTRLARRKLHAKEVGLVMLDLHLKGEDGKSICSYIKGEQDLKNIPVILVSGNPDLVEIRQQCGADDYIAKPFSLNDFMAKVNTYTPAI